MLGNDQEELSRLKLQHDLWRGELIKLWDLSRIKHSKKILDLGCGPGFTSLDILAYNSEICELTSVDFSNDFLDYFRHQIKVLSPSNKVDIRQANIEQLNLEEKSFDTAFCRWLMIFVNNPRLAVEQVHKHLKSGSEFIIQEYVSYDSMDLVPNSKNMKAVVDAVFKSWKDQGGDPNRGKFLPSILETSGFRVKHLEPIAKFARPGEPLWFWPESFYKSFLPRLERNNYLTAAQVKDFFQEWEQAKTEKGSFFVAPTVINIIAEKL